MKYQNENFDGNYDFRCNYHDGWHISLHLHAYSEIIYCAKGSGKVIINGQPFLLKEKQLIWIPPNYLHQYRFEQGQAICAVFSPDLIPLYFKLSEGRQLTVAPVDMDELAAVVQQLPFIDKNAKNALPQISGYLNLICARVLEHNNFTSAQQMDGVLLQKVVSYLSRNYTQDITLKQIARKFGYHEKYLSHALYQLTGIHFRHLLALYRVEHAAQLLRTQPKISISEAAIRCGYSAGNTFCRVFREQTGMTPIAYRKKYGC